VISEISDGDLNWHSQTSSLVHREMRPVVNDECNLCEKIF